MTNSEEMHRKSKTINFKPNGKTMIYMYPSFHSMMVMVKSMSDQVVHKARVLVSQFL